MTQAPAVLELLRRHGLRVTDARQDVLRTFVGKHFALTHADLEAQLPSYDRVTLYRTLSTFETHGLVHKVLDDGGMAKYALCSTACAEHRHADNHVHFKCVRCGQTECLEGVAVAVPPLPVGYAAEQVNVLVQGRCPRCMAQ